MMFVQRLIVGVFVLLACAGASAGERYFYHRGNLAYYCQQPASYRDGCYIVCDQPNVSRIGQYPTITTAAANRLCNSCSSSSSVLVNGMGQRVPADPCCGGGPSLANCWPILGPRCDCNVSGRPEPAPPSPPGPLAVVVKPGSTYYQAIVVINGTVPVPQVCVTKSENYTFEPLTLRYDCAAILKASGKAPECEEDTCKQDCTVTTCRVLERTSDCNVTCVFCPVRGPLVLAIRQGGQLADVFIGKVGNEDGFKAYPANTRILRDANASTINQQLQLGANEAVNLAALANDPANQQTDLFAFLR